MNYVADLIYVFPSVQGIVDREAAALLPELITLVTLAKYFEQLIIYIFVVYKLYFDPYQIATRTWNIEHHNNESTLLNFQTLTLIGK